MEILSLFKHALMISFFVFVMMMLVDFVDYAAKSRISNALQGGCFRQYALASLLGSTPGCLGAFMNVSLYVHGIISFGAIVGGMIATSGDEAFVMLVQFPRTALILFTLLFVCGILFAWVADRVILIFHLTPSAYCADHRCEHCELDLDGESGTDRMISLSGIITNLRRLSFARFLLIAVVAGFLGFTTFGMAGPSFWSGKRIAFTLLGLCSLWMIMVCSEHYLQDHIWGHIIKSHISRVFLWTFGALIVVNWGILCGDLGAIMDQRMELVLISAALLGIIPESGPHLIFVMMYAEGLVPFSVLFTASFVQDGHGMLPMLSFSLKDSLLIKGLNLLFGLAMGGMLFALGV